MATANMYAMSLRHESRAPEKARESGVAFFVPHLAKVKTNIMCQTNSKHLLFCYEKAPDGADAPLSPTTSALPYRKQGNQSHYTDENMRKRQKLMDDRRVIAGIARFWDTFPAVRQGQSAIEQRDYVDVFMKFYKALVAPHEFSIGEARKIVERDWGRDVGDSESMSKVLFFRSLFEVADIWTVGISADEYTSFLNKLFDRVTMKIQDHKTSLWVTVFAELDRIRSFGEPKERNVDPDDVAAETNQEQEMLKLLTSSAEAFVSFKSSAAGAGSSAASSGSASSSATAKSGGAATRSGAAATKTSATKSGGGGSAAAVTSSSKARPPLLKKKSLSSSDGLLAADSASTGAAAVAPTLPAPGASSSFRRLPEIAALPSSATSDAASTAATGTAALPLPSSLLDDAQATRSSLSATTKESPSKTLARASDAKLRSPMQKLLTEKGEGSSSSADSASSGPITYRQSRFQRSGSLKGDAFAGGGSPSRRVAIDDPGLKESSGNTTARSSATSELPPQPIRLAMPSIYLSPDLTESQATYRAARRRIRESTKLAQRLRRITF